LFLLAEDKGLRVVLQNFGRKRIENFVSDAVSGGGTRGPAFSGNLQG